jgi:hypothetical protein
MGFDGAGGLRQAPEDCALDDVFPPFGTGPPMSVLPHSYNTIQIGKLG